MTHADAVAVLRSLALGLAPDMAGCDRLLERVAAHPDAEALRDALTELGAQALLDSGTRRGTP